LTGGSQEIDHFQLSSFPDRRIVSGHFG
jgi:hypothetical protein